MRYLFNSKGQHVANSLNQRLYAPNGKNIGHYLEKEKVFIDLKGHYLGELVQENRLLYNAAAAIKNSSLGLYGDYGSIGNYGDPGNYGRIGLAAGFQDVSAPWLASKI